MTKGFNQSSKIKREAKLISRKTMVNCRRGHNILISSKNVIAREIGEKYAMAISLNHAMPSQ